MAYYLADNMEEGIKIEEWASGLEGSIVYGGILRPNLITS